MEKKIWRLERRTVFSRDTCWWPTRHHYLSKPGGEGGGLGGGGGVAYKDRARLPPRGLLLILERMRCTHTHTHTHTHLCRNQQENH